MTDNKKEFKNLQMNKAFFVGKVVGAPSIGQTADGSEYVTANLRVFTYEMQANGQGAETEMIVPLFSTVQTVVNGFKHVVDGHHVQIDAYYKNWNDASGPQHTMVVTRIQLGSKPYIAPEAAA